MKPARVVLLLAVTAFAQNISVAAARPQPNSPSRFRPTIPHRLEQPDPAKALVYVIEDQKFTFARKVTARVGLDGAWVGANRGNSYLFFAVEPGQHHLCTDWTSSFLSNGRLVSLANFTAEAGKVYYFRARTCAAKFELASIDLDEVNSDEGRLMVTSRSLSVSHPKK
jgi:Protein of unknown function (DUF2846)